MLDQIDLSRSISKEEYRTRLPILQARLFALEQALLETRTPVLIAFEGWAGTSKISTISVLMRRLDPRGLRVYPITPPRTYEMQYPWLQRFWLKIPRYGQFAIFDRSWYRELLASRTRKHLDTAGWHDRCNDIVSFERQLAADGAVIVKFWMHISREEQERRFKHLTADPLTSWQVTEDDRWQQRHYKRVKTAVEDIIARTDMPYAPWIVLPATNQRYARIAMFQTVIDAVSRHIGVTLPAADGLTEESFDETGAAIRHRLDLLRGVLANHKPSSFPVTFDLPTAPANSTAPFTPTEVAVPSLSAPTLAMSTSPQAATLATEAVPVPTAYASPGILARVNLQQEVDMATFDQQLARLQAKLHLLGYKVYQQQRPVVLVFEGWDAAGKGGAIQRITAEIDPRSYVVHPISAPSGDDKAHHYLYRFWRRLPPRGQIAIFDRSWYGRVLVERIEGFARPDEWQRAYAEINEFERQLVDFGTIIGKFWMHISPDEQLRRFEERQRVSYKSWKLTDEDWRNREKWPLYEQAADEMLLRTATPSAPWTIVEAENKRFGRLKVLRTVVRLLESELGHVEL